MYILFRSEIYRHTALSCGGIFVLAIHNIIVYNVGMNRYNIVLTDKINKWLTDEAKRQGKSKSQLIRDIVMSAMSKELDVLSSDDILKALGAWIEAND